MQVITRHLSRRLFEHASITILLVGELGVEDQRRGLRQVAILLRVNWFCGFVPKGKFTCRSQKDLNEIKQQNSHTSVAVPLDFLKKSADSEFPTLF